VARGEGAETVRRYVVLDDEPDSGGVYHAASGAQIWAVTEEAIKRAGDKTLLDGPNVAVSLGRAEVHFEFNDLVLTVRPNDKPEVICKLYSLMMERLREERQRERMESGR
jgi:hypothetical protein